MITAPVKPKKEEQALVNPSMSSINGTSGWCRCFFCMLHVEEWTCPNRFQKVSNKVVTNLSVTGPEQFYIDSFGSDHPSKKRFASTQLPVGGCVEKWRSTIAAGAYNRFAYFDLFCFEMIWLWISSFILFAWFTVFWCFLCVCDSWTGWLAKKDIQWSALSSIPDALKAPKSQEGTKQKPLSRSTAKPLL